MIKKPILLTAGPASVSLDVKKRMLVDIGHRTSEFKEILEDTHSYILKIAGVSNKDYAALLLQGSATQGMESSIKSLSSKNSKWLIIVNGFYGNRLVRIVSANNINHVILDFSENIPFSINKLNEILLLDKDITHIAMVHCETSLGFLNDLKNVGLLSHLYGKFFLVDACSSFGSHHIDFDGSYIDFMITSPNKCLESVPGVSIAIFNKERTLLRLNDCGYSQSILEHYTFYKKNNNLMFTSPTHVILSLHQSMINHVNDGGVEHRGKVYIERQLFILERMGDIGFKPVVAEDFRCNSITSFHVVGYDNNCIDFNVIQGGLSRHGVYIYDGLSKIFNSFRIGNMGDISFDELSFALAKIGEVVSCHS